MVFALLKFLFAVADILRMRFVCDSLKEGGHLYYVGAGSLGIMGLIDASECPPTYGASEFIVSTV